MAEATDADNTDWRQKYEKEKKDKKNAQTKLKKAKKDIERASSHYKKRIDICKGKQDALLKHISSTNYSSKKKETKLIFMEDIKQIIIGEKGVDCSVDIVFGSGEQQTFYNIQVVDTVTGTATATATVHAAESDHKSNGNITASTAKNKPKRKSQPSPATMHMAVDATSSYNSSSQQQQLHDILIAELAARSKDIEHLTQLQFQQKCVLNDSESSSSEQQQQQQDRNVDDIVLQMRRSLDACVQQIQARHSSQFSNLNSQLQQRIVDNNREWRQTLSSCPMDVAAILSYELNDRIYDVQNVKDVLYKNDLALYESMDDVLRDIESRHNECVQSWQKSQNTKHKHKNKNTTQTTSTQFVQEFAENNSRWRKQIHFDVKLHANVVTASSDSSRASFKQKTTSKAVAVAPIRWLFANQARNDFIDSLQVNQHSVKLLTFVGAYINRIVSVSDDLKQLDLHSLYIPIRTTDPRSVIVSCLDGVLLAVLINLVAANTIDVRVLHTPQARAPQPLNEDQIADNMRVVFTSLRSLNIQLPRVGVDEYLDIHHTVNILLCVAVQCFYARLDHKLNVRTHAELMRLCQNDSERQNASCFSYRDWQNKYLLHLKDPASLPLQTIPNPRSVVKHVKTKSGKFKRTANGDRGANRRSSMMSHQIEVERMLRAKKSRLSLKATSSVPVTPVLPESAESAITSVPATSSAVMRAVLEADQKEMEMEQEQEAQAELLQGGEGGYALTKFATDAELMRDILHSIDYHDYLILICCRLDADFLSQQMPRIQEMRQSKDGTHDRVSSQLIMSCLQTLVAQKSVVEAKDICDRNPLFQQLLISEVLRYHSTLTTVNALEKKMVSQLTYTPSRGEQTLVAWMNACLAAGSDDTQWFVRDMRNAVRDGAVLLKLLDRMRPGCVDVDVEMQNSAPVNAKLVLDVCQEQFALNVAGMSSTDIVAGNAKYVGKLVSQMMWFQCTRSLSLTADKKNNNKVTEKTVLQWSNDRIKRYKKWVSTPAKAKVMAGHEQKLKLSPIKSLRDKHLNDSLLFLNLLSSIDGQWIDYDCVSVVPSAHGTTYQALRLSNAQLCITVIRRLGMKIFVSASDVCAGRENANLWVLTHIMRIAAKYRDNDALNHTIAAK